MKGKIGMSREGGYIHQDEGEEARLSKHVDKMERQLEAHQSAPYLSAQEVNRIKENLARLREKITALRNIAYSEERHGNQEKR